MCELCEVDWMCSWMLKFCVMTVPLNGDDETELFLLMLLLASSSLVVCVWCGVC